MEMSSTLYSKRHDPLEGRGRKERPKTFATEEAARKWAAEKKIKNFSLMPAKKGKFSVKIL
jgi:hypothetical protein